MIAAGTQATEGSDWRPERFGPIAARTVFTRATSSPGGVPIATETAEPRAPRETLVQMWPRRVPSERHGPDGPPTSSGPGGT
ncbi:hypothetical protein SBADM41S_00225 [Streptomyces badius]